jgi:glycosyltransferase involved in cell wall biosynthesis
MNGVKIRLLWIGDSPAVTTGFGRVSQSIMENLFETEKYEIYCLGINHPMGDPHRYEGMIKIFPARAKGNVYGINRVEEVIDKVKPHIIIINNDFWIVNEYLKLISEKNKIITYSPIDALPVQQMWIDTINYTNSKCVVYTKFARKGVLEKSPNADVRIIGHGVDTDNFYPMDDAREFVSVPKDGFIIQNVNRNQPRKRLDLWLKAAAMFYDRQKVKDKEKIYFYYHGTLNDLGWNLLDLARRFGIGNRLLVTDQQGINPSSGVPVPVLNKVYNCADVQIMTSMGEGFGLSPFESAACAVPQVVPNSSATKELWEGIAPLIDIDHYDVLTGGINTEGAVIDIESCANIMEDLYHNRDKLEALGKAHYEHVHQEKFTWEYVAKLFDELINEVLEDENMFSRKYVPPKADEHEVKVDAEENKTKGVEEDTDEH